MPGQLAMGLEGTGADTGPVVDGLGLGAAACRGLGAAAWSSVGLQQIGLGPAVACCSA